MEYIEILWKLWWPMVFYGLAVDMASLIFKDLGGLGCTLIGALISLPFLWKAYGKEEEKGSLSLAEVFLCVAGGIGGCVLVNTLIRVSGLGKIFTGFSQVSGQLYRPPLWLQVCAMGVGIPLAEELVFRGLVFGRIRKDWPFLKAAVISALLFGIYHGNVLQGIYGFVMGIVFAVVMERKKTIMAPVLMHVSANLTSVAMTMIRSVR